MKDLKNFIIESKKKVKNLSDDVLKFDILGLAKNDKEINNAIDSWLETHDKSTLQLYLDDNAASFFKAERLSYEFVRINKNEINNVLDSLKDGKSYSNDYIEVTINDDIIYSKTPDGIVIIK
jgi:hypothetical protein